MNFSSEVTLHVFFVTFGVLLIASVIGFVLGKKA
ncbi:MAG: hypothetical protein JWO08_357, partial [Verrucomicrobiaceae bacterium]|nr:hypothetical protein [Verrucomicrobiaceae bacterium]